MSKAAGGAPPDFDKVVHEQARLRILVYLASSSEAEAGFTDLKRDLGMTAGNLSVQLGTLEAAGYITVRKAFIGRKPFTGASLSPLGERALANYLDGMESILALLRKGR